MQKIRTLTEIENKAVQDFVGGIKEKYGKNIEKIIMFGSKARGDFSQDSDIDILVVTNNKNISRTISDEAFDILLKYGVYLSLKIMELSHFQKINNVMTGFSQNIKKEGIVLWKNQ